MNSLQITEKFHEQFYLMKTMKTKYRLRIDNNNNLFVNTDKHNYISYKRKLHIFFAQLIPKYYLFLEKFFSELIISSNDENKIIAIKNINLISIIHYGFNILKSKYQFRHNKDRYTKFLILIGMFEIILFKTKLQYIKQFCTKGDSYTITCSCDFCNSLEKII